MPTTATEKTVQISAPNIESITLDIEGTAPYVQARFSEKARNMMLEKQLAGSTARKGKKREARNLEEDYEGSLYRGPEGQYGIPATCFRNAMISVCRLVNFKMTLAKLSIFTRADYFDPRDGTPLVAIEGEPKSITLPVRNATGVADLRVRAIWHKWSAKITFDYDADQFSSEDIVNLLHRVGTQGGIGEGRPNSKSSAGMGWGTFKVLGGTK